MVDEITKLKETATAEIDRLNSPEDFENFRLKYLSRKGLLAQFFERMKDVPKEEKPSVGKSLNELRGFLESEFESAKKRIVDKKAASNAMVDTHHSPDANGTSAENIQSHKPSTK